MKELFKRQNYTEEQIIKLRNKLDKRSAELVKDKACVYATGSCGRVEASEHSDLDLFILGKTGRDKDGNKVSSLKRLDAICLQADLIRIADELKFPRFSGDGEFLTHHSVHDLIKTLGTSKDDVTNTFTARLLLLLESKCLLEDQVYDEVLKEVIKSYWRNFDDHSSEFMPVFLANDIIRLWRTFCVNYEANLIKAKGDNKAKSRLNNYKLKHSRVMTCYSALCWLLHVYEKHETVTPDDVFNMSRITPTGRIEYILNDGPLNNSRDELEKLLVQYGEFLEKTNVDKDSLLKNFSDEEMKNVYKNDASVFGDLMFRVLERIGKESSFYRHLVV